jgi:hypothetical protein
MTYELVTVATFDVLPVLIRGGCNGFNSPTNL